MSPLADQQVTVEYDDGRLNQRGGVAARTVQVVQGTMLMELVVRLETLYRRQYVRWSDFSVRLGRGAGLVERPRAKTLLKDGDRVLVESWLPV